MIVAAQDSLSVVPTEQWCLVDVVVVFASYEHTLYVDKQGAYKLFSFGIVDRE